VIQWLLGGAELLPARNPVKGGSLAKDDFIIFFLRTGARTLVRLGDSARAASGSNHYMSLIIKLADGDL